MAGGIFGFLGYLANHRGAVEFDWRAQFGIGLREVAHGAMSLSEAARLAEILARDPSTRLCAALNGWDYPFSQEALVLADLYDLWTDDNAKPYPRPWNKPTSTVVGRGGGLTPEQFDERWRVLSERAELRRLASLSNPNRGAR